MLTLLFSAPGGRVRDSKSFEHRDKEKEEEIFPFGPTEEVVEELDYQEMRRDPLFGGGDRGI